MKGQQYQFDLWRKQERLPYRLRVLHCDVHCGGVVRNGDAHSPAVGLCCSRFVGLVARNPKREARNEMFEKSRLHIGVVLSTPDSWTVSTLEYVMDH
jgi:hypothetical protein